MPQVSELIKKTNKHIQFEVEVKMASMGMFGGGSEGDSDGIEQPPANLSADSSDYQEVTENDVNELAKILGGGM